METPTCPVEITLRKGSEHDLLAVTELVDLGNARTSLPKEAHLALSCTAVPGMISPALKEDRLWIVERGSERIGYFLIWSACSYHKWVEFICVFSASTSEEQVTRAFQSMLDIFFRTLQFHRVIFLVSPLETFFFSIAHNLSLFLEGTLRKHLAMDGEWYDVCLFAQNVDERFSWGMKTVVSKACRFTWLLQQAQYDGIQLLVVRAIILRGQRTGIDVLLLQRSQDAAFPGLEEPPGTRILEGETILTALNRAVELQTGLGMTDDAVFLTSFDFTTEDGEKVREFVFRVKPLTWEVKVNTKDHSSFEWLPLPDLHKSRLHPDLIHILSSYSPTLSFESVGLPGHEHDAMIELVRPPSPQLQEALIIGHHLDAFAAKGLGEIDRIGLILRDSANRIVGGLTADMAYGCIHMKRLWVDPNWRRLGWGKKLMARAESIAKEKGCRFATAYVMDWEDLPFFQKNGYVIENQILGFDNDSGQFRCRKMLT